MNKLTHDHVLDSDDIKVNDMMNEELQVLFDSTPLCTHLWDREFNMLNCNEECLRMFHCTSKQEFITHFLVFCPEFQSDGRLSAEVARDYISIAFKEGYVDFDFMHCLADKTPIPTHVILKRILYNNQTSVVAYVHDRRVDYGIIKSLEDSNIETMEQLSAIWENVDSGLVIIDTTNRQILNMNPAAEKLYGGPKNQLIGKSCSVLFGAHSCPILDEGKDVVSEERELTCADQSKLPVIKSVSKINYGGTIALLECFNDISLIKEAQLKLQSSMISKHTKLVLDKDPQMNLLYDKNRNVIDCNQATIDFMGFTSKEEFINQFTTAMEDSFQPILSTGEVIPSLEEQFAETLRKGETTYEYEFSIGGEFKRVIAVKKTIPYEDDIAVVAYLIDITKDFLLKQEIIKSKQSMDLQVAKLNMAVEASRIGLWDFEFCNGDLHHPDSKVTWSNDMRHILGFRDTDDFPNDLRSWSYRLHPDDHDRVINQLNNHIMDKTGQTPYTVEYRLLKKDDTFAFVKAAGKTWRDDNGEPIRTVGSLTDITETKQLIVDAERQKRIADEANKAKTKFLSTMSHEIRTPLNAILGIAEIQLLNESLDRTLIDAFEKIRQSGDLLLGIINDILDLSKIEAGKLDMSCSKYEVASLISDTSQLNMIRIGSKDITYEVEIIGKLPVLLYGDELRIKQIINNILSNAFKYTKAGKVTMSVRVDEGLTAHDKVLIIAVKDTGQGMTEEQLNQLYDEFARFNLESNQYTEGTGLGMSITHKLINLMKGRMTVHSEVGVGTTFTVFIPQGVVSTDMMSAELIDQLQNFKTSSIKTLQHIAIHRERMPYGTVLVVDDMETSSFVTRGLLRPYDVQVESVNSGFAAIDLIKVGKIYSVILMDHMMPQMDGVETVKILRNLNYKGPIVALTANAVAGQADMFLHHGFDGFISKPIDVRCLDSIMNEYVKDKQCYQ